MRRFELSEGTANKFWQIVVDGAELRVQWGRIGTAGQSQTKTFGSDIIARKELEKLVLEKTKKGYIEVSGADGANTAPASSQAAAAPAKAPKSKAAKAVATTPTVEDVATPAPAPASEKVETVSGAAASETTSAPEASTASSLDDRLVWTDNKRSRCSHSTKHERPIPSADRTTEPLSRVKTHYQRTRDVSGKWDLYEQIENGAKHATAQLHALAQNVAATYGAGKLPPSFDPQLDAAAAHYGPAETLAEIWLAHGGITRIAEVFAHTHTMFACTVVGQVDSALYLRAHEGVPEPKLAEWVRRIVDTATEDERAKVLAILERARQTAGLDARLQIAIAANCREWAEEDASAWLGGAKMSSWDAARSFFKIVRSPTLCTKLAAKSPNEVPVYDLTRDLEWDALPSVIKAFEKDPKNTWNAEALAMFQSVPAAKALAAALAHKATASIAKEYFEARPDLAVSALAGTATGTGKLAPFVKPVYEAALRSTGAKTGGSSTSAANAVPVASAAEVPGVLTTPPAGKPLPDFVTSASLSPVLLADKKAALPESASMALLRFLHASKLDAPAKGLADVKQACDGASLSAFAWALFEAWLASGVGSKENWAFTALGLLGDDEVARRLTPFIRSWPGESQHARAGVGLDILGAIGTDVALMHLDGVAQAVKYKALQERAREKIAAIAKTRGLTAEELSDRLAPDLGLGADGSLVLDFGPRQFKVGFDAELEPFVLDSSGKRIAALPKPAKSDDAELAQAATERWKALKKDAKAVAKLQIRRLELAMCAERRWSVDVFKAVFVEHPLVYHLARRLVWGVHDGSKLVRTFRVAEDRTFADTNDGLATLAPDAIVGLPHRLELDDATTAAWGKVFGDYEILQPFAQLERSTFIASAEEQSLSSLGKTVSAKTARIRGLEDRGWQKGPAEDAGWVYSMTKKLAGGFEAYLSLDGGLCMGSPEMTPSEQEVSGPSLEDKATFGQLSPVAFSELVLDIESLREA